MGRLRNWKIRRDQLRAPVVAERRAAVMSEGDLRVWADSTLYAIGRSLSESSKDHDPEKALLFLTNAVAETAVLQVLVDELAGRAQGKSETQVGGLYG